MFQLGNKGEEIKTTKFKVKLEASLLYLMHLTGYGEWMQKGRDATEKWKPKLIIGFIPRVQALNGSQQAWLQTAEWIAKKVCYYKFGKSRATTPHPGNPDMDDDTGNTCC